MSYAIQIPVVEVEFDVWMYGNGTSSKAHLLVIPTSHNECFFFFFESVTHNEYHPLQLYILKVYFESN